MNMWKRGSEIDNMQQSEARKHDLTSCLVDRKPNNRQLTIAKTDARTVSRGLCLESISKPLNQFLRLDAVT